MNIKEADKELAVLANGTFRRVQYEFITFDGGADANTQQSCTVYIAGYGIHSGETWRVALNKISREILPPKPTEIEEFEENVSMKSLDGLDIIITTYGVQLALPGGTIVEIYSLTTGEEIPF